MQLTKSQVILSTLMVALWIRATLGFVAQEIMPALRQALPVVLLAFDAVVALLGAWTMTHRRDWLWAAVLVAFTSAITLGLNHMGLLFYLNGMRDFLGLLVAVPILRFFRDDDERWHTFVERIDRFLYLYLLLQVPCNIYQFLVHGAGDHVGGSLGDYTSGTTSTLVYLISFYLLNKRLDRGHLLASLRQNAQFLLLLLPTFLNETKVSFVFLLLYLALLLPLDRKIFVRATVAIPVIGLLLYGAATIYIMSTGGKAGDIFSIEYYTESYLMSADADETEKYVKWFLENEDEAMDDISLTGDVPRFTKFLFLNELHDEEPGHRLTGWGVGHFKGGTIVPESDFYTQNEWMLSGTIPYLFHLLVQVGWLGVALVAVFFAMLLGLPPRPGLRRDFNLQFYLIALVLLIMVYQDFFRNLFVCLIVFYTAFQAWHEPHEAAE